MLPLAGDLEVTGKHDLPLAGDFHITWSMPAIGVPSSSSPAIPCS